MARGRSEVDIIGANGLEPVSPTNPLPVAMEGGLEYETVAASQTGQSLGATGALGDYIEQLVIIPATTSPGLVTLLDGAVSIPLFVGGASSVPNLLPIIVPLRLKSVSGAWKVTTGANVAVLAVGDFT